MTPKGTTESFIHALKQTEETRDASPLVQLFHEEAELENPARGVLRRGRDGATRFWDEYLAAFSTVRSQFHEIRSAEEMAVLEWTSEGVLPDGKPIRYRGVSILEFRDGTVGRFCTYYDSAAFLPQGSKHSADLAAAQWPDQQQAARH